MCGTARATGFYSERLKFNTSFNAASDTLCPINRDIVSLSILVPKYLTAKSPHVFFPHPRTSLELKMNNFPPRNSVKVQGKTSICPASRERSLVYCIVLLTSQQKSCGRACIPRTRAVLPVWASTEAAGLHASFILVENRRHHC